MHFEPVTWTIEELYAQKDKILLQPKFQRSAVWSAAKKKLLIDSILREYDLPKFYLVKTEGNLLHDFEVEDGQQRARAIFEFIDGVEDLKLESATIDGVDVEGHTYQSLREESEELGRKLMAFKLDISLITSATPEELRTLFARLQLGEKLNSPELRNAIASNLGSAIKSITENNGFFSPTCKIGKSKYKHQEYLDMAIGASHYDCTRDIKAPDLKVMYLEFADKALNQMQPMLKKANTVLDYMNETNALKNGIFKNKWTFVDVFALLYKHFDTIKAVRHQAFMEKFIAFDKKRVEFGRQPELLIKSKRSKIYDPELYRYSLAFQRDGAAKRNLLTRQEALETKFLNATVLEFNPSRK